MLSARVVVKALARRLCGRHPMTALGAAGIAVLVVAAVFVRLSFGPLPADGLAPLLERNLARQVEGGRADIGRVGVVWFEDAGALGLQLDDVRLVDGRGRPVLLAGRVQAAVALDSLFAFTTAPGRIAAEDFFAAVSVSPQGKYELGYDAGGAPKLVTGLDRLFADMTGRPRMGRPMSFLRELDLKNGRLALREVGGTVNWVADVAEIEFRKAGGRLSAHADLAVRDRDARAGLQAQAQASVGLRDAFVRAEVRDLVPARVFPSVGVTRSLSALDAQVRGRGSLAYGAATGVRAADVAFSAGRGSLRFGTTRQAFDSARVVAGYDPRSGDVEVQALQLAAERTRLELAGRLRLLPEDRKKRTPARLDFDVRGPRVLGALSADAPPQELTEVVARGRYTPELRRIEIAQGRARVAGAPVSAQGVLFQNRRGAWGADLTARLEGAVGREQVFAFWPKTLGAGARTWLARSVTGGRFSNAVLTLDAPAGAFDRKVLRDQNLKLTFDFQDAGLRFMPTMPAVTAGAGSAVLQGNRFDLVMTSGRLDTLSLSEGMVEIPRLKPGGARITIKARAAGEAQAMLRVVDGTPSRILTSHDFAPERMTGAADVRVEIVRPLASGATLKEHEIRYAGTVRGATLSKAALGWDLDDGELSLEGDLQGVKAKGTAEVGPYRGGVDFASVFTKDGAETVEIDGQVRAATFGGRPDRTVSLTGKFRTRGGRGEGGFRSAAGDGKVEWSKHADGGARFSLDGQADARGLGAAGAGFVDGLPDRFPVQLAMTAANGTWSGDLEADALSGSIAYTPGARARLLYRAQVTPLEARRLGVGRLPLFEQTRSVLVDAAWSGGEGAAQVDAGGLDLAMSWARSADGSVERRLRSALSPADLDALGLPNILKPGATLPVALAWRTGAEGMVGSADFAGTPARFQAGPLRAGARQFVVWTAIDREALRRWGAPDLLDFDGEAPVAVRWTAMEDQPLAGRVDVDLTPAFVGVPRSEWRKPAGLAARLAVAFVREADGDLRLSRISGEGQDFELAGSAALTADGRLVALDLQKAKLTGLIDGALRLWREPTGTTVNLSVDGRWLDARRLFDRLSAPAGDGGAGRRSAVKFDAQLSGLRLTDQAVLRDVRASGLWGASPARRLDLAARTPGGGTVSGRVFPLAGGTGLAFETDNAGDLAKTLFDVSTLRGGSAVVTGRLVPGGADFDLDMSDVRLIRAPTMAQILTVASLQGIADTLNGEGVMFTRVVAPVQVRGSRIQVGEARATGPALGLTTKGVADLKADTLDFEGTIAPAYALNSAMGAVPVVGKLLVSRQGEGVVGLGYSARGSFAKPQVMVNPLSLMTPGILRRLFETPPPANRPKREVRGSG